MIYNIIVNFFSPFSKKINIQNDAAFVLPHRKMLPIDTPVPKIAKKAQTGREQQTPNVFDTFFCCVKLPPINEALYNMNNKKALCLYCYTFNISDYERFASVISGNNCLLLDDMRCYVCQKDVYFFKQRADQCRICTATLRERFHSLLNTDSESDSESDLESDSESNEVDYDSEASTVILEN